MCETCLKTDCEDCNRGLNTCDKCIEGTPGDVSTRKVLFNNACLGNCPSGYTLNATSFKCERCPDTCTKDCDNRDASCPTSPPPAKCTTFGCDTCYDKANGLEVCDGCISN